MSKITLTEVVDGAEHFLEPACHANSKFLSGFRWNSGV